MLTASGSQPTMFVVNRSPACSSSSTIATTYGTGTSGRNPCRLTVNVNTVPRPLTGRGSSGPPHPAHVARGGCTQRPHAAHHQIRSGPPPPPVQNGLLASVLEGGIRSLIASLTPEE